MGFGGTDIPKTNDAAKPGRRAGSGTNNELKLQQMMFDLEKQRIELDKERAVQQSENARHRAEAEASLLKEKLEENFRESSRSQEGIREQNNLLTKIFSLFAKKSAEDGNRTTEGNKFVAKLVGYQAIKRLSSEIIRGLNSMVGLGNEVRILIVDRLDYAQGDLSLIEVTSHFSVFEVRCRKQVAANKELSEGRLINEESEEEKTTPVKVSPTRLGLLRSSSSFFPNATGAPDAIRHKVFSDIAAPAKMEFTADPGRDMEYGQITDSLIAAVAGSLRSEKRKVYVYNFYSMDTVGPQSKLMNMYAALADCSGRLCQSRNRLSYFINKSKARLSELHEEMQIMEMQNSRTPENGQMLQLLKRETEQEALWLDRAIPAVLASDAIHGEIGHFMKAVTADHAQTSSRLAKAVFREKVRELGITHLLYLHVVSSGGESSTRQWFWGSGNSTHFGGAVVSYILSRVEGDILASETLPLLYTMEFDASGQRNSALRQIRFDKPEKK
jgi:hypothetical protein